MTIAAVKGLLAPLDGGRVIARRRKGGGNVEIRLGGIDGSKPAVDLLEKSLLLVASKSVRVLHAGAGIEELHLLGCTHLVHGL